MAGVTSRDGRLPLLLPTVIVILIMVKSLKAKVVIIETSQSICGVNQLTGLYMMVTLTFNDLLVLNRHFKIWMVKEFCLLNLTVCLVTITVLIR